MLLLCGLILPLRGRGCVYWLLGRGRLAIVQRTIVGGCECRLRGTIWYGRAWLLRRVVRRAIWLALPLCWRWQRLLRRSTLLPLLLLIPDCHLIAGHPARGIECNTDSIRARRALVMRCLLGH